MNIAIGALLALIFLAQPIMLLGLSIIFLVMAVFSRPFSWQDVTTSLAVMAVAVVLIQWNGGWEHISIDNYPNHWEY